MPIIPPTPFLPRSRHQVEEHSLLIDVEPTFDDSFDDWSVSDQPKLPTGVTLEQPTVVSDYLAVPKSFSLADKADLEPSEYGGRGQAIKNQSISEWSGSVKRSREESPLPSCGQKRVKPPTPVRDDFYRRRVNDSDRRSSLGPTASNMNGSSSISLYRSVSHMSALSASSRRSFAADKPLFTSTEVLTACDSDDPTTQASTSKLTMRPPLLPPTCQTRSHLPPDLPFSGEVDSLIRTDSRSSVTSSTRRNSITQRVTGFLSGLIRRKSLVAETSEAEEQLPCHAEEVTNAGTKQEEYHYTEKMANATSGPKLRLPPPLTRPASRPLATTARALQPKKIISSNKQPITSNLDPSSSKLATNKIPLRKGPPRPSRSTLPSSTSSFAARAISRLPPLGKGTTSTVRPVTISNTERAPDLKVKREKFERLAREAADERARSLSKYSAPPPRSSNAMSRTVPVKGSTPGKASRQRAEERARFERGLRERHEEKERRDAALFSAREEMERAEDKVARADRVISARELPAVYTARLHAQRSAPGL